MRIMLRGILLILVLAITASLVGCTAFGMRSHAGQFGEPYPYDCERAAIDAKKKADVEAWEAYRERKIVRGLGGVIYNYN